MFEDRTFADDVFDYKRRELTYSQRLLQVHAVLSQSHSLTVEHHRARKHEFEISDLVLCWKDCEDL